MTTTLTITSGQTSFTAQNYVILPSPGTAVPDSVAPLILAAAQYAGVVLSSSAGTGVITVPSRRFNRSGVGPPVSGEGSWLLGDEVVDSTGAEYECSAPGNPGTWTTAQSGSFVQRKAHSTTTPMATLTQAPSGRIYCGVDATSGKVWSYNSGGLYQVDTLTATNWAAVTLPTNCATTGGAAGGEPKVVVWTPPAGSPTMFALLWNTSTTRFEVYSAPLVARTVAPTWTGPLLTFANNAMIIPTAIRATSTGLFFGEYSLGSNNIAAGPSLYRTANGTTFTTVLGPLATTRHVHGVYEDPYSLGTIYVTVGDGGIPHWVYKSTDGGATFNPVTTLDALTWQSVSMGFTADYVWFLSDQITSGGAYVCDRATMTPRWATMATKYSNKPVPGGASSRTVTDLTLTGGQAGIASVAAAFTSSDVGRYVWGPNGIAVNNYIASVATTTIASGSNAATLPQGTVNVASTSGFASPAGTIAVSTGSGTQIVTYTGTTGTTFTGCTGGTGTLSTGGAVVQAVLANNAITGGTGNTAVISGDMFYATAYMGGVDPATGYLYVVTNDTSIAGTVGGLFVLPGVGGDWALLYPLFNASSALSHYEAYFAGGYLFFGRYGPMPLWNAATP